MMERFGSSSIAIVSGREKILRAATVIAAHMFNFGRNHHEHIRHCGKRTQDCKNPAQPHREYRGSPIASFYGDRGPTPVVLERVRLAPRQIPFVHLAIYEMTCWDMDMRSTGVLRLECLKCGAPRSSAMKVSEAERNKARPLRSTGLDLLMALADISVDLCPTAHGFRAAV